MARDHHSPSKCEGCGHHGIQGVRKTTIDGETHNLCSRCSRERAFQRGEVA